MLCRRRNPSAVHRLVSGIESSLSRRARLEHQISPRFAAMCFSIYRLRKSFPIRSTSRRVHRPLCHTEMTSRRTHCRSRNVDELLGLAIIASHANAAAMERSHALIARNIEHSARTMRHILVAKRTTTHHLQRAMFQPVCADHPNGQIPRTVLWDPEPLRIRTFR